MNDAGCLFLLFTLLGTVNTLSAGMNTSIVGDQNSSSWSTLPTGTTARDLTDQSLPDPKQSQSNRRSAIVRLKRYIQDLPTSRGKVAPSVMDDFGAWKVDLRAIVAVVTVLGIDDVKETMTSGLYITLEWEDTSLAWNTSDYQGVDEIHIPVDAVWTPSLHLGNSRDILSKMQWKNDIEVSPDGNLELHVPVNVETQCSLDLTHYPYDEQVCPVIIMSVSEHYRWKVIHSFVYSKMLARFLEIGSEWEMVNTSVQLHGIDNESNNSVKILLHLRRKTTFYTVCLVLPMVMTSYMNTLVFLLPPESGEKISFLVSIFVSTSVFLSYFTSVMPRGLDRVPSTMRLLLGVIIESLLVLLATILVLRRFHQQQRPTEQDDRLKMDQSGAPSTANDAILPSDRRRNLILSVKAEILDRLFFVVAFIGNTIFLAILLYQSLKSRATNTVIM